MTSLTHLNQSIMEEERNRFITNISTFEAMRFKFLNTCKNLGASLQWRHNEHGGVSNHQPRESFIQVQIKENFKDPRHWPLCEESGEFPAQKASNSEKVSIWWRHHSVSYFWLFLFQLHLYFHALI